jgi:hypothetical protein
LQKEILTKIKDGVSARDVYLEALAYVKEKNPDIEKNFVKNLGFGVFVISLQFLHTLRSTLDGLGISGLGVPSLTQKRSPIEKRYGFQPGPWI